VVLAGIGGDAVTTGAGSDLILGDDGVVHFDAAGLVTDIATLDAALGGDDVIAAGEGDNVVVGGAGSDTIVTGSGADFILGDNGSGDFVVVNGQRSLRRLQSTDPLAGGADRIEAGVGNDLVVGGTGNDTILGGEGNDRLFGDHALYDTALPPNQRGIAIFTGPQDGAGDDWIEGGDGDDVIFGQQGNDMLAGDAGDDDLVGGSNVIGAADGNDTLSGGAGADVVLGDNGIIARLVLVDDVKAVSWLRDPDPFGGIRREVVPFDLIDGIGGNDIIAGNDGDDRLFGQRGDDGIEGGDGDDEIVGGLGNDALGGGAGRDVILGDVGRIVRAYRPDGSAVLDSDGSWHRDVVLEEVGTVTAVMRADSRLMVDVTLQIDALAKSDLLLATGARDAAGAALRMAGGNLDTSVLAVSLAPAGNDLIDGGDGDDGLFGQRGDDTIRGGAGDDLIFGDRASNTAETASDMPTIVNAVRLIGAPDSAGLDLPLGGAVVVPAANLMPQVLNGSAPHITVYPNLAGALGEIAGAGPIRRNDGTALTVYASVVPNLVDTHGVLPGNDVIEGGAGDDTIYGDDVQISSLDVTRLSALNGQIDAVTLSMQRLLETLDALTAGVDMTDAARGNRSPEMLRYGNDTIAGGDGTDTIVGDQARIVVRGRGPLDDLSVASTVALGDFLSDMRWVVSDLTATVSRANEFVVAAMARLAGPAGVFKAPPHQLVLGNDVIDAGAGDDLVAGDTLILTQAGVARTDATLDPRDGAWAMAVNAVIGARAADQDRALSAHLTKDHPADTAAQGVIDIVFGNGQGYALTIGNDRIAGGSGTDVLVGDAAFIQLPVPGTSEGGATSPDSLAADRIQVLARLFSGTTIPFSSTGATRGTAILLGAATSGWGPDGRRYARDAGAVTNNRDVIDGGDGANRIFGDAVMLVPALDAAGRLVGPTALYAIAPGPVGLAQGAVTLGLGGASIGLLRASGTPGYTLNWANGSPVAGQTGGGELAAYNAAYWSTPGTGSVYGFYGTTGTASGSVSAPLSSTTSGTAPLASKLAATVDGTGPGGVPVPPPPFLHNPKPGKKAVLAWFRQTAAAMPWLTAGQILAAMTGTTPVPQSTSAGTGTGTSTGNADEITGGTGYSAPGASASPPSWSFDAGVTRPAMGRQAARLLAAQVSADTPIKGLAHKPLMPADVIRVIQNTTIVARVVPTDPDAERDRYTTYILDEASGSLERQAEADGIRFY
ncbi:hypothetical protein ACQVP2_26550, partial [Methylobacterium aquaticum]